MHTCLCVCMHVWTCLCACVCAHTCVFLCMCVCVRARAHTCACVRMCVCACARVCACACMCVCVYVCVHTLGMHAHVCVCVCVCYYTMLFTILQPGALWPGCSSGKLSSIRLFYSITCSRSICDFPALDPKLAFSQFGRQALCEACTLELEYHCPWPFSRRLRRHVLLSHAWGRTYSHACLYAFEYYWVQPEFVLLSLALTQDHTVHSELPSVTPFSPEEQSGLCHPPLIYSQGKRCWCSIIKFGEVFLIELRIASFYLQSAKNI